MERRLTAILAADIVGYSRLMGIDEARTLAAVKRHRVELIDNAIAAHRGRIVKLTGDGMLLEFPSVVNAVTCAADIQKNMFLRNKGVPGDQRIELRIGINLGDVIVEDGDIFGDGVNVAARLEGIAEPGGIAVSASVRDHVGSRVDVVFDDRGEYCLKNIAQSIRVYTISFGAPSAFRGRLPTPSANDGKRLIAVLPFVNMSDDPEQEYFSDGITEDIITDLTKISGLDVAARNTVFTYKGKSIKVKQLAHELGVHFVLEGSVRKVGQRVRITGQLIDARNGGHLWADRYDRDLTDIFAIQDEITHAIVDQLKVKLLPEEKKAIESEPTANVEAYTYYLRGRQFSHAWTRSYLLLARRMFLKAVELDPNYARAYAGIAACYAALRDWNAAEFPLETIMAMSARALELDPDLAEAHASRGLALHQSCRNEEAIAAFTRALELEPDLYEANFHYARCLFMQGSFEEAVYYFERSAEIRTDDYLSPVHLMSAHRSLGRPSERERWARIGIARAERALDLNPENSGPAHRGALALAHLGEADRAREWSARALAIDPEDIVAQYNIACVYSMLGDLDAAIDLLEMLLPHGSAYHVLWFSHDSDLDPLRELPRFQELLAALAAEPAPII
ncbi:adenylate/guanylate cyclase domain-containing protein [Rhizobium tubonense]|uniref:adenylate/guanylate cyclase domain-containing protein n=1 Tax=Rhizobium tubonense TaxID=484088 RepID=UPI001FCEB8BA|nr:adenylate/guanylate cyclase domain-containing protein [Rhizobium tubonense]